VKVSRPCLRKGRDPVRVFEVEVRSATADEEETERKRT